VKTYFDTATLYYRAFHAVPESIVAPDGTPSGAVRGFLDMVSTLLTQFPAEEVVFAWDDDWRPAWRVALIPSYKTHRVEEVGADDEAESVPDLLSPQISAIAEILDCIGLVRLGQVGHEADDILGALIAQRGGPAHVVTGDRDLYQLVSDVRHTDVVSITKGVKNLEVITDDVLRGKYSVTGEQYAGYSALRGDASDGLPGVKGVGEKTAATLITQWGSLSGVLAAATNPESGLKESLRLNLAAHEEYLAAALKVVTVRTDAHLPKVLRVPKHIADPERLTFLTNDWGIEKHVARLLKTIGIR